VDRPLGSPHRAVNAPALGRPSGFSHAIVAGPGPTVYLAGQTATGPDGEVVGDTMTAQFKVAADNLLTALEAAGGRPEHLVSMLIFVTDLKLYRLELKLIGTAYRERFGNHYPAMALVEVKGLWDPNAMIELQAIAVIPG
jgi:enamine deaminase RidA (YjgF/YER057c/UK114 family)